MNRYQHFNDRTRIYMNTFYAILEEMIWGMTKAKLTDSIGENFIRQMIPHHKAAIEMSKNVLRYTKNQQVCQIAAEIIEEQTKSIQKMEQIASNCSVFVNGKEELECYNETVNAVMSGMFGQMRGAKTTNSISCNFMQEMIPHHEGAVKMASAAIQYQVCPKLNEILYSIIVSQKEGICRMQKLSEIKCE